jgi:NodT family efflux transporter outer membrane factor (OMF) lipoprotein
MKKTLKLGVTLLLSAAVGGCAVGIDYKRPKVATPAVFGEAHRGPTTQAVAVVDLTQWWTTFHDAELESLIKRAIASNLDLLTAEARVRQARAQLGVEQALLFPTVDANASATKSQSSRNVGGFNNQVGAATGERRVDLYQGGFDAGWEVDVFGGTRRAIEAASADLESQVDARRNVLVSITAEVARDYILLRGDQAQLALTYSNLKSQQDTLDLTRSRFRAQLISDLDVAQAQANVATTASQIPALQIQIKQTMHALGILLGQEPMALAVELEKTAPIPPTPSEVPVGVPSELLRRRPDVRQAERQLAAATANIGVAVAQLFPKFSLTGSLGQESTRFGLIARADGSSFWSIGPTVSWRIFDANQLRDQVRVQNALQEQALLTYQKTVLQSFSDVEDALVAYAQDQNRTKSLAESVSANQRAVSLSNQLYRAGLGDFLNVLTAERNLYSAQLEMTLSQSNVATDLVQLYKALGGGWDANNEQQFQKNEDPALPANDPVPAGQKVAMK